METESSSYISKRSFFGLGKKKKKTDKVKSSPSSPPKEVTSPTLEPEPESEEEELEPLTTIPISATAPQLPLFASMSPINTSPTNAFAEFISPQINSPISPIRSSGSNSSPPLASCPDTSGVATPRLSTSSSQIFERNVQEQLSGTNPPPPNPHATPAHIQTENHIPAVLEASSIAITDSKCDVDEVEIVMHSMHQPAVSVVAPHGVSTPSSIYDTHSRSQSSDHILDESTGNSGDDHSTAAADKRRLSFISFADVVQAELAEHDSSINHSPPGGSPNLVPTDRDPGLSTINETLQRSPSPIRLGSSPPRYCAGNVQRSPSGRSAGMVLPPKLSLGDSLGMERGELTIETMRQALRKTGSGDLSGYSRGPLKHGAGA